MLITHVKSNELLGKTVYDSDGKALGRVVGIAGRSGIVKAVILRNAEKVLRLPVGNEAAPRLRVLR